MKTKATKAALRQEIEELRHVGGRMSNLCFNLAQKENQPADVRVTMDELRRQWDAIQRREKHERD